jgi:hypothetical protein
MSRKTRDVAGILHFLTPQQMAEEIVRLDAALSARSAEPVKPEPFPRRFLKAIKEMADPEKCWEYGDGDPMADDAALAVQWIEARAALNAAHVLASPTDDYDWKAEALKHRDRLTRIGRTMVPEGSFFWDDITEGAVKRLSSPPPLASLPGEGGEAAQADSTIREISQAVASMMASRTELVDGLGDVHGYQIKTGALHRILGHLSAAGHPVVISRTANVSVSLPEVSAASAGGEPVGQTKEKA